MVGKLRFAPAGAEGFDEGVLCYNSFHDVLNRAPIARHSLQLPEGKRGELGFQKMHRTLSVWGYPHVFQSTPGTRTQQADGAWGTDCFGSAQAFAHGSFGAHTEG